VQPRGSHVRYFIEKDGSPHKWIPARAISSLSLAELKEEVISSALDEVVKQVDGFRFSLSGIANPIHTNVRNEDDFAEMKEIFWIYIKERRASIAASPNKANQPIVILIRPLKKATVETGRHEQDEEMAIW
jgi:hypothetical protein